MNYRHVYHAGNFADVVKHAVLALAIEHLKLKPTPFCVVDTHAGTASYDLEAGAAVRTGEWRDGIGRLLGPEAEPIPPECCDLLRPYLDVVRAFNRPGALTRYPGSSRIARSLMRPQDRIVMNELHPQDAARLARAFGRDPQSRVLRLDGWTVLKSVLPPKERRGVVLIDPPFEQPGEFDTMAEALREAVRRFSTGLYILWYPAKDPKLVNGFRRRLVDDGHARLLDVELRVGRSIGEGHRLDACGLAILNPPHLLDESLRTLVQFLAARLGREGSGGYHVTWLAGERSAAPNTR
jgi:23S rRNA (adenine2030-N6)-methyltransferase